jgi:alpha-tubulin suppressor-like RCC1 family protein/tRNA A-37 threonylcarbamoyl transferase component Bud32
MGTETHQSEPKEVGELLNNKIIAIDANADQSFAVTNEGLVYSWGDGAKGQLGQGNRLPSFKPKLVEALVTKRIIAIAAGFDHTLALSEDGDVYSWGSNSYGQLGLGHEKSTSSPKYISTFKEKQIVRISAGGSCSAALTKEGDVYTWGWGFDGRLGHFDNKDLSLPKRVTGLSQVVDISAGFGHMLAVTESGELYTWGNNTKGQLGHGDKKDRNRPKLVITKYKFYRVHAGFGHSLALSDKNTVYSWGSGDEGRLGHGDTKEQLLPKEISAMREVKIMAICAGGNFSMALSRDGMIYSWGNGARGQLGHVSLKDIWTPKEVVSLRHFRVKAIACGDNHAMALAAIEAKKNSSDNIGFKNSSDREIVMQREELEIQRRKLEIEEQKLAKRLREVEQQAKELQMKQLNTDQMLYQISYNELQFEKKLGEGTFGKVYQGSWNGVEVAIKKLKQFSESDIDDAKKEVELLVKLRSPNVVLFMGMCFEHPNYCIVTEFMGGGDLYNLLHKKNVSLTPKQLKQFAVDIASGLAYLHQMRPMIVHRDLKSLNILLDLDLSRAKIADFGLSKMLQDSSKMTSNVGTPIWMAPEVMEGKEYTEKADVYSFGLILYEMVMRKIPFQDMNYIQLGMEVVKGKRPSLIECPPAWARIIRHCWDADPDKRIDMRDALDLIKRIPIEKM